jgi:2-oxoglutarate ferredoxin oxidoreductase subunit beta
VREHNEAVSRIDFIDLAKEVIAEPGPGEVIEVPQADGSTMRLRKLHADHDPTDRRAAMNHVQAMQVDGEIATGLLYVDPQASDLHAALNTVHKPLNTLGERELCPGAGLLARPPRSASGRSAAAARTRGRAACPRHAAE